MTQSPIVITTSGSLRREATTLGPPLLVLGALLLAATQYDARPTALLSASAVVLLGHVLPGAVLWRLVRPERGWLVEDLAVGFGLGAALSVPGHALAVTVGRPALGILLPVGMAAVALAVPASRQRVLSRHTERLPWLWGAAVSVCALVPTLVNWRAFLEPVRFRGWTVQYVDLPYHTALAHAVSERFPPHYPQVAQEPLTYHWFAHAWTAQVSSVSGVDVGVLITRFNPSLMAVAVPLITAAAALRITGRHWAGPAAAAVAFLLLDVNPWGTPGLSNPMASPMSPTQQFGLLVLLTLVTVLALRWRGESSRAGLPVLVLLLVVAGGSKGSVLPIVAAGALAAAVAVLAIRDRARLRLVGTDALLTVIILVLLNRLMFGGGNGGVSLDFGQDFVSERGSTVLGREVELGSGLGVLSMVLVLVPLLLAVVAGAALVRDRETRADPMTWLLLGGGVAGLGAMVALTHPGSSQNYFYKTGEPLLAIAAAWGAAVLWERSGSDRRVLVAGLVTGPLAIAVTRLLLDRDGAPGADGALIALAGLLVLVTLGALVGARTTGTGRSGGIAVAAVALLAAGIVPTTVAVARWDPPEAVEATETSSGVIHGRDVRALRWLGARSERGDLVATNKHCLSRVTDPCDRRRFFIGAHSGRSTLVEGWSYNRRAAPLYKDYGSALFRDDQFWDLDLMALNDGFIAAPTAAGASGLWDLGVRWIVVWRDAPHADDLAPYAERVRRGLAVEVYRLNPPE